MKRVALVDDLLQRAFLGEEARELEEEELERSRGVSKCFKSLERENVAQR